MILPIVVFLWINGIVDIVCFITIGGDFIAEGVEWSWIKAVTTLYLVKINALSFVVAIP